MPAKRTNITIPASLYEAAQKQMDSEHYETFREYVGELVRRDAVRHENKITLRETASQPWGGKEKRAS